MQKTETKEKKVRRLILGEEKDAVLRENEVEANKVLAVAGQASAITFTVVWILHETGVFYSYHMGLSRILYPVMIVQLLAGSVIGRYFHFDRSWIKYLLMAMLIGAFATANVLFTYNVTILMMIPVVLSSRYFSKRYTMLISVISAVIFLIATVFGAYMSEPDLNSLELPAGTVLSMKEDTWIYDAILRDNIPYDRGLYVRDVLLYRFLVVILQFLIVSAICVTMAGQGRKMILKQKRLTEETSKVGAELAVAAGIQMDVLPAPFPAFPDRREFELYASMSPAKEVGGDFYDFFLVDEDHLYMCVADVSGKGIPAAMFMMASKNILAEHVRMGKSPAQILTDANAALCINNKENMFVTVWVAILEISTGKLTAASAGHEYPMICGRDGRFFLFKDVHGIALGMFDDFEYQEYEYLLESGMKIFSYTDGVTEATDPEDKMFGTERLADALNADPQATPEQLLKWVRQEVDAFVREAEQFDDLTMLCLHYKGQDGYGKEMNYDPAEYKI